MVAGLYDLPHNLILKKCTISMTDNDQSDPSDEDDNLIDVVAKESARSFSQATGNLLERALGPAVDEVGEIIVAHIRSWRWRKENLESIAQMHADEVECRKVDIDTLQPLPEGDAYRFMEAASMEDNETVQQLWAGLITSAMDPSSKTQINKAYIDILQAIGPIETGLLLLIQRINAPLPKLPAGTDPKDMMRVRHEIMVHEIPKINEFADKVWRHYSHTEKESAIQNLMRLRCLGFRRGRQLKANDLMRSVPMVRDSEVQVNARGVAEALDYLESLTMAVSGTASVKSPTGRIQHNPDISESLYDFTALGLTLMNACDIQIAII